MTSHFSAKQTEAGIRAARLVLTLTTGGMKSISLSLRNNITKLSNFTLCASVASATQQEEYFYLPHRPPREGPVTQRMEGTQNCV